MLFIIVPTYSMSLMPLSHNEDTSSLSTETTEILSSTSSSETGICRPNGNIQNEWSVSDYTRIDDEVKLPDPGDGSSNSHQGFSESKIDIFDMTTQEEEKIIIAITIHLYCECQITTVGSAKIESSYRFGSQGEWSSVKSVISPFSMAWKSFTWDGLSVSKSQLDNLQIKLRAYISASGYGGWVQVDVMYVEVAYYSDEVKIGISRPNGNVQNQWSVSDYTRIDDVVELPDPGDGSSNSHQGFSESKIDIFDMTTQEEEKIIIAITIHLYCECQITTVGSAKIESSYRFGSQGEWSSVKSVISPFSMAWKSFTWDGLSVSKSQLDNLQIKLRAYISASGYGGWVQVDVMYVEVAYYVRPGEKIGVFMWCSEVGTQSIINQYKNVLIQKDYTTFFEYEDPGIYNVFPDIEDYDIPLDTIFFYFYGHGYYDSRYDNSYCYLHPSLRTSSQMLRYLMDTLEAERKGFLMEACYSGGFVDDFQDEPYLAMSSSSKNLPAYGYDSPPGEGVFSDYFWTFAGLGQNAVGAFTFARFQNRISFWWPWQDPQIADYTTGYDFF